MSTWLTNSGTWTVTSNWSGGAGANTGTAAYFASGTLTGDVLVFRPNSAGAAQGMTFDYANGTVSLRGLGTSSSITIGAGGITMTAASGAVTVGADGAQRLQLILSTGSQTWQNDSQNLLTVGNVGTSPTLVTGSAGSQFTLAGSGAIFMNRVITGSAAILKQGSGLLRLAGANTFQGGLTLAGGTLSLENGAALGTGTFTIAGGSIDVNAGRGTTNNNAQNWNGDFAFLGTSGTLNLGTGAVTLGNGSRQVTVSGSTLTVGGVIGEAAAGYGLTKAGAGTLVLTATSTYTGVTSVAAGTLQLGNAGTSGGLGTASSVTGSAGATLAFNRTNTVTQGTDFSSSLGGGLSLTQLGSGTLVLNVANTYTGTTTLAAGAIQAGDAAALGTEGPIVFRGGRLRYTAASAGIDFGSRIQSSGSAVLLDLNGQDVTLSGIDATNVSGLSWTGTTTLTLAGTSQYSGGTTLAANQRLNINGDAALGSGALIVGGATPTIDNTSGSPVVIANDLNLNNGAPTFAGSFPLSITGTTILSNLNPNTARTVTVTAGTLTLRTLAATGANAATSGFTKGGNGTLVITDPADASFQGTFTQNGGRTIIGGRSSIGTGTVALSSGTLSTLSAAVFGNATINAPTTLSGSSMTFGSLLNSGASTLTNSIAAGQTLRITGTTFLQESGTGIGRTLTVAGSGDTVFEGPIVNGGTAGTSNLTINAPGASVTLSAINTYSGITTLSGGTAVIGSNADAFGTSRLAFAGGALASTGSLTLTNGLNTMTGSLVYVGSGELYVSGTLDVASPSGSGNLYLPGRIFDIRSGTFGVSDLTGLNSTRGWTKTGDGTLLITGSNAAKGFAVDSGVARLGGSGRFATDVLVRTGTADYAGLSRTQGAVLLGGTNAPGAVAAVLTSSGTLTTTGATGVTMNSGSGVSGLIMGNLLMTNGVSSVLVTVNESTDAVADLTISANVIASSTANTPVRFHKNGPGTLAISGSTSATGVSILAGILRVDTVEALPEGNLNIGTDGAQLGLNLPGTFSRPLGTGAGQVRIQGGGSGAGFAAYGGTTRPVNLGGSGATVTWGNTGSNFLDGTTAAFYLGAADADGTVEFQNGIDFGSLTESRRFLVTSGSGTAVDARITGALTSDNNPIKGLRKQGNGILQLSAANTYSGTTSIESGMLQIGAGGTTGSLNTASVITGSAGATLAFNRSNTITSGSQFAATIGGAINVSQLGSGTLVLAGANTYTGTTSLAAGTLRVSGSGRIASSAAIDVASGAVLAFARADDYGGAYDGKLTGSGFLSVQSGSLTLTGLNTFAGNSEVLSGAVLQLDGQINNTALDISSGATLMGSGTILGTTTIAGLHRPGNSPGIQTLQNLTYLSGASVQWELWGNTSTNGSPADFDQIVVTGDLAFDAATNFNLLFTGSASPTNFSDVAWSNSFWNSDQEWLVYNVTGTTTGAQNLTLVQTNWQDSNGFTFNSVRSMSSFRLEKRANNNVYLVYSAIPEPGSLCLAGIGLAAAAIRWLRHRGRPVA